MSNHQSQKPNIWILILITLAILSGCTSKKKDDLQLDELKTGTKYIVKMSALADPDTGKRKEIDDETVQTVKRVLSNRLRGSGIRSLSIKNQEDKNLLIMVPEDSDSDLIKYLITTVGHLEIKEQVSARKDKSVRWKTVMDGSAIKKATAEKMRNRPVINVVIKDSFKKEFSEITGRNVGKPVGIFLDSELIDSPNVVEPIYRGKFIISGGKMNFDKSRKVAILLDSGSLPVKLKILKIVTPEGKIMKTPLPAPTGKENDKK